MNTQLQHDPKTKQQLKDALYAVLYDPVQRQFQRRKEAIIGQNTLLGQYAHNSFAYKGTLYSADQNKPPRKANRLLPQMVPAMEAYLGELKALNEQEVPYVLGYINQVLNASNDFDDYLRLLPESLHNVIRQFQASCPCHNHNLPEETVQEFRQRNAASLNLMRQRMAINLII